MIGCMCNCINDSILNSVKKQIGADNNCTHFDPDLIMHINSVFATLAQIGCGPETGFMIFDDTATWSDYTKDNMLLNFVVSYMGLKVKLLFDPPSSSFVLSAMERQASEFEWRISAIVDPKNIPEPDPQPVEDDYYIT